MNSLQTKNLSADTCLAAKAAGMTIGKGIEACIPKQDELVPTLLDGLDFFVSTGSSTQTTRGWLKSNKANASYAEHPKWGATIDSDIGTSTTTIKLEKSADFFVTSATSLWESLKSSPRELVKRKFFRTSQGRTP